MTTQEILEAARGAKTAVALSDSGTRDSALLGMADALCAPESMDAILAANAEDMAAAKGRISDVMLDRLALTPQRIEAMAKGIRDVAALPDPVGRVLSRIERPNGLVIEKTAVPMGVIAIIYESRPNVTSDAAALAIKSGNACILRCGKEAWRSANAIVTTLRQGLRAAGLPETKRVGNHAFGNIKDLSTIIVRCNCKLNYVFADSGFQANLQTYDRENYTDFRIVLGKELNATIYRLFADFADHIRLGKMKVEVEKGNKTYYIKDEAVYAKRGDRLKESFKKSNGKEQS